MSHVSRPVGVEVLRVLELAQSSAAWRPDHEPDPREILDELAEAFDALDSRGMSDVAHLANEQGLRELIHALGWKRVGYEVAHQ